MSESGADFGERAAQMAAEAHGTATAESESERARREAWESAIADAERLGRIGQLDAAFKEVRDFARDPELAKYSGYKEQLEHTLKSVADARAAVEKDGPNKGKYKVEIKDSNGNVRKHADGSDMVQYEGVPVDKLADALVMAASEYAASLPEHASAAKKYYEELRHQYDLQYAPEYQPQDGERAIDPMELRKAERDYQQLQREASDPSISKEVNHLRALAATLDKNSVPYFRAHFDSSPLSAEESERQHARTEYEAMLTSADVRASQDQDHEKRMQQDYAKAMEELSRRRELVLVDEHDEPKLEPKPEPTVEPKAPAEPEPEPAPVPDTTATAANFAEPTPAVPNIIKDGDFPDQGEQPAIDHTLPGDFPDDAAKSPQEPMVDFGPQPEPTAPKLPERRGVIVNATELAGSLAEFRGDLRLNKILNEKLSFTSFFKKMWFRALEAGYRQQFIEQERAKIYDRQAHEQKLAKRAHNNKKHLGHWVKENSILGLNDAPEWANQAHESGLAAEPEPQPAPEAYPGRSPNLFLDEALRGESTAELQALLQRFEQGFISNVEGETKEAMQDQQFSKEINDLIFEYASPGHDQHGEVWMSDEDFVQRKTKVMQKISKKYPDQLNGDQLNVDNFLEAAKEYREYYRHSKNLCRVDVNLQIDLGLAKKALKTDANLGWIDMQIDRMQKNGMGRIVNPTVAAFGLSVAGYLAKKPASALLGAAGMAGALAYMRRGKDVRMDASMHRRERAMGHSINDYGNKAERRERMEEFVYEMKPVREISESLQNLRLEFDTYPSDKNRELLEVAIAECEARMSLSELNRIDLIKYEGETQMERGRLMLMKNMAECKVALHNGRPMEAQDQQKYAELVERQKATLESGEHGIKGVDKEFKSYRRKQQVVAGVAGAVFGAAVGTVVEQGLAGVHDAVTDFAPRPLTTLEHFSNVLQGHPDAAALKTHPDLTLISNHGERTGTITVPEGTQLVPDRTAGMYALVDGNGHSLVDHIQFDKDTGELVHSHIIDNAVHYADANPGTSHAVDVQRIYETFGDRIQHIHRAGWYDQDTPQFDENELRLTYGINGLGIDEHNNVDLDLSHLVQGGSRHGGHVADLQRVIADDKLRILYSPDRNHANDSMAFHLDAQNHLRIPADAATQLGFVRGAGGKLDFHGYIEVAEEVGQNQYKIIATMPGGAPMVVSSHAHQFTVDQAWTPLVLGYNPRQPLEELQPRKDERALGAVPNAEEQQDAPQYQRRLNKQRYRNGVGVAARETQAVYTDSQRYEILPEQGPPQEVNPRAAAKFFVLDSGAPVLAGDKAYNLLKTEDERVNYIEQKIVDERKEYTFEKYEYLYKATLAAGKAAEKVLEKYGYSGEVAVDIPEVQVHFLGNYDFAAAAESRNAQALSTSFMDRGDVYINVGALHDRPVAEQTEDVTHLVTHHIIQLAANSNYWRFENVDQNKYDSFAPRREGLVQIRRATSRSKTKPTTDDNHLIERGRALNEAVIERLTLESLQQLDYQKAVAGEKPHQRTFEIYKPEQIVLESISKKHNIPFETFAAAYIDRKKLPELVRAADGMIHIVTYEGMDKKISRGRTRQHFFPLLLEVMDYEAKHNSRAYERTHSLINEQPFSLPLAVVREFSPSLLTPDGQNLKKEVAVAYKIKVGV